VLGVHVVKFTFESAQGQEIRIHKALLEQSSQLFHQMFMKPSQDHLDFLSSRLFCTIKANPSQTEWGYHLPPRFDYKVLQILIEFMYNRTLKDVREYSGTIRDVFHLASDLEVPSYMDRVLAELRDRHQNTNGGFAMNEVEDIYNNKFRINGRLWQYCLENVAGRMAKGDVSFCINDWIMFAKRHPGVAQEFMEHQLLTTRDRIAQVADNYWDIGKDDEDTATVTSDESTTTSIEENMDVDEAGAAQIEKSEKTKELAAEWKKIITVKKKAKKAKGIKSAQHKHKNRKEKITVPKIAPKNGKKKARRGKQTPIVSGQPDDSMIRSMEGADLETFQPREEVAVRSKSEGKKVSWAGPSNSSRTQEGQEVKEAGARNFCGSLRQAHLLGREQDRAREASMVFKTEPGGGRSVSSVPTGPRFAWQV
jgi:hypothetical protein